MSNKVISTGKVFKTGSTDVEGFTFYAWSAYGTLSPMSWANSLAQCFPTLTFWRFYNFFLLYKIWSGNEAASCLLLPWNVGSILQKTSQATRWMSTKVIPTGKMFHTDSTVALNTYYAPGTCSLVLWECILVAQCFPTLTFCVLTILQNMMEMRWVMIMRSRVESKMIL